MEGRIQSALKQILMLRKVQVTPGDTFMITDSKSKILLSIYEVWLWSSRNDFIVLLKGSHATWSL